MPGDPPFIGIDLVEPERLGQRLAHNPGLKGELFSPAEVAYSEGQPHPIEHLAARYCAKEAVVKALAIDGFDPLDVEVLGGGEATAVRLHGPVLDRARELGVEVSISLTHVATMAAAVAMARPTSSS